MNLKEALIQKLPAKLAPFAPKAFDSFGNIAVMEIPKELNKKKKLIGETLISMNPRFETVCSIESDHKGKFRVQKVKVIAGKKQTIATYKEYGCTFLIPLGKVFFSPRLSGERTRIAGLIQPGEIVGAWFSGVGPYPIIFSKHSKMQSAVAIELNPFGHKYAKKNAELNKVKNVEFVKGDVKKVYKKFKQKFDRIAMPLPHTGYQFLKEAFYCAKPGAVIHMYEIIHKGDYSLPESQIMGEAKKAKRRVEIIYKNKVREFSPTKEQVVFDILVLD
ncbi:tRNA (guanine(37)-N1)-methyltransferase Trm5b [uncultured archaeon]|nr:tRNA (guanine(37)-N1)-methyltransferase Trm5b [uncultured archaeon]